MRRYGGVLGDILGWDPPSGIETVLGRCRSFGDIGLDRVMWQMLVAIRNQNCKHRTMTLENGQK